MIGNSKVCVWKIVFGSILGAVQNAGRTRNDGNLVGITSKRNIGNVLMHVISLGNQIWGPKTSNLDLWLYACKDGINCHPSSTHWAKISIIFPSTLFTSLSEKMLSKSGWKLHGNWSFRTLKNMCGFIKHCCLSVSIDPLLMACIDRCQK